MSRDAGALASKNLAARTLLAPLVAMGGLLACVQEHEAPPSVPPVVLGGEPAEEEPEAEVRDPIDLEDERADAEDRDADEARVDDEERPPPLGPLPPAEEPAPLDGPTTDDAAGETEGTAAATPRIETVFNVPITGPDFSIEDRIVALIDSAKAGSRVRISLYDLSRMRVARALVRAFERGVDLGLILDGGVRDQGGSAWDLLQTSLPSSAMTVCGTGNDTSCIGTGINHNKLFLFEELNDGRRHVVAQSSANMTSSQTRQHNNMVIVLDEQLFGSLLEVWQDQRAQYEDADYYRTLDGDGPVRAYVFPRESGDTILSVLGNVQCNSPARIQVAMAFFADSRIDVAHRLVELHEEGCSVSLVQRSVAAETSAPGQDVLETLLEGGVEVALLPKDEAAHQYTLHSKYLLIDAPYEGAGGVTRRTLVFTGSHNWTDRALRANDELLLRVDDPSAFQAFRDNWERLHGLALLAADP